jgi:hypothetical protein
MTKYVEIHLMLEKQTLRDIKLMCNVKRLVGREDMCSEAWLKVFEAMDDQKNAADIILKCYKEETDI